MIGLVPNATPLFAVISVRRVPQCEHLVIAYSDEKALRDLLAKPSIVALGYSSREEAQISISRDGTRHMRREAMANLVADKARSAVSCSRLWPRLLLSFIRRTRCVQPSALWFHFRVGTSGER